MGITLDGTNGIDLDGTELKLDADADTSITADTDDRIDFKIAGSDRGNIHYDGNDFFSLESNDYLTLVQNQTAERGIIFGPTYFKPYNANDTQLDLGIQAARWKNLYLSGGVVFDAVTGNATSNTLDDYEEGTFTPTFNTTGGGESFTYTTQLGYYLKIGAFVWVSMAIGWSNRSGGSGQLRLGNLPFAPAGGSRRALAGMPYSNCWTGLSNAYNIQPHSNIVNAAAGTYFWYTSGNGNIAAYIQSADLSSSGDLQTVLGYESSA